MIRCVSCRYTEMKHKFFVMYRVCKKQQEKCRVVRVVQWRDSIHYDNTWLQIIYSILTWEKEKEDTHNETSTVNGILNEASTRSFIQRNMEFSEASVPFHIHVP